MEKKESFPMTLRLIGVCLLSVILLSPVARASSPVMPAPLAPWADWVLRDVRDVHCTRLEERSRRQCLWPGELTLQPAGATWMFRWALTTEAESVVTLPGGIGQWPFDVRRNGQDLPVRRLADRPVVTLPAGDWVVTGRLRPDPRVGSLPLPHEAARLKLRGFTEQWVLDDQQRLRRLDTPEGTSSGLPRIQVHRLLTLERPATLQTRVRVESARMGVVMTLGPLVPEGFRLMALESPLPARLEADGRLTVQLAAGQWEIVARMRATQVPLRVPALVGAPPWPDYEIWSVNPGEHAGRVTVQGEAVEPARADVPAPWRQWSAWKVSASRGMELLKSVVTPARPLARLTASTDIWWVEGASRPLWHSVITGQSGASGQLDWAAAWQPLRALQGGETLPLQLREDGGFRLPLPRQQVQVAVTGMLGYTSQATHVQLPVSHTQPAPEQHDIRLHVPVGERLLAIQGAARTQGTWLARWTLWDMFFAALIVLAIGRRFGWYAGLVALPALILAYQEMMAPVWSLLVLVIAYAIPVWGLRSRRWIRRFRALSWLVVVLQSMTFSILQMQSLLYPQLDDAVTGVPQDTAVIAQAETLAGVTALPEKMPRHLKAPERLSDGVLRAEPPLPVEVGPGVPQGRYVTARAEVVPTFEEGLTVWRLTRTQVRLARALMLVSWVLLLVIVVFRCRSITGSGMISLLGVLLVAGAPDSRAQAFPPEPMLEALRAELLRPPLCDPGCVSAGTAELLGDAYSLSLSLSVSAEAAGALRLPRFKDESSSIRFGAQWYMDGAPVTHLWRDDQGEIWARVPEGVHEWVVNVSVRELNRVVLHWPDAPADLSLQVSDWHVVGMKGRRLAADDLVLERIALPKRKAEAPPAFARPAVQPYVKVERVLTLGQVWWLSTRVERVAPERGDLTVRVPLLVGEAPLSELPVEHNQVQVTLPDGQKTLSWSSTLPATTVIRLTAPALAERVETWRLSADTRWQVSWQGPTPTEWMAPDGRWQPTWKPEPGDHLEIQVSPAQILTGQRLNVDGVSINQKMGRFADEIEVIWRLRTTAQDVFSVGGLARGKHLNAWLNGRPVGIGNEAGVLSWTLPPGEHRLRLSWQQTGPNGSGQAPPLEFVGSWQNLKYTLQVPPDRWVLWTWGPTDGPAVLFWGGWLILLAVACVLGWHRMNPIGTWSWCLLATGAALGWVGAFPAVVIWVYAVVLGVPRIVALRGWLRVVGWGGLGLLTLTVMVALLSAVPKGLNGVPPDAIAGVDSHAGQLVWRADWVAGQLPDAGAWTAPLWLYRVLMLLWSLWLAFAVTGWLKWFSSFIVSARSTAPVAAGAVHSSLDSGSNDET